MMLGSCAPPSEIADEPQLQAPVAEAQAKPPDPAPAVYALESEDDIPTRPTKILDQTALARLKANTGLTLQWLGWDKRGTLKVYEIKDEIWIEGQQGNPEKDDAFLYVNGLVREIGSDYFILDGEISIFGTPDAERRCLGKNSQWRFAVTENRKYWRLREFEWCDGLTDYVDIYF